MAVADAFVTVANSKFAIDYTIGVPKHNIFRFDVPDGKGGVRRAQRTQSTTPSPALRDAMSERRGAFADSLDEGKHAKYGSIYKYERKYLVPVAFDVYGCPSKNTQLFLTSVFKISEAQGAGSSAGDAYRELVADVSASLALDLAQNAVRYRVNCAQPGAAGQGFLGGDPDGDSDLDDAVDDDSGGGPSVVASQSSGDDL